MVIWIHVVRCINATCVTYSILQYSMLQLFIRREKKLKCFHGELSDLVVSHLSITVTYIKWYLITAPGRTFVQIYSFASGLFSDTSALFSLLCAQQTPDWVVFHFRDDTASLAICRYRYQSDTLTSHEQIIIIIYGRACDVTPRDRTRQ